MILTFPKGGIHPPSRKRTADREIISLPLPKTVVIPMIQHIGAPAVPIVKVGQHLKTGELIGEGQGYISSNIHSSVTGVVSAIKDVMDSSGYKRQSVIIDVEPDIWVEGIDRTRKFVPEIERSPEKIINLIKEKGIVGMGGATFPTHIKLKLPKGKSVNTLIINGAECEPSLTADHRLMLKRTEEILIGIKNMMRALRIDNAYFGIENNKQDALRKVGSYLKNYPGIKVVALKVKYPQGGEKQLIKSIINKEVPSGGLPIDLGVIVQNVGTAFAVYEAVQKNKPIISRIVTVTGTSLKHPGNFRARIGTSFSYLIKAAGGVPEDTGKIINGGPLMGKSQSSIEIPVVKGTSGILLLTKRVSKRRRMLNCTRCAKCVSVCPMGLEPYILMIMAQSKHYELMQDYSVLDCIECGSCSYICPSRRPLLDYIRLGKIIAMKKK